MFLRNFLSIWISTVLIAVLTIVATSIAYNHRTAKASPSPSPN